MKPMYRHKSPFVSMFSQKVDQKLMSHFAWFSSLIMCLYPLFFTLVPYIECVLFHFPHPIMCLCPLFFILVPYIECALFHFISVHKETNSSFVFLILYTKTIFLFLMQACWSPFSNKVGHKSPILIHS